MFGEGTVWACAPDISKRLAATAANNFFMESNVVSEVGEARAMPQSIALKEEASL
jgi:hypothetical protein